MRKQKMRRIEITDSTNGKILDLIRKNIKDTMSMHKDAVDQTSKNKLYADAERLYSLLKEFQSAKEF